MARWAALAGLVAAAAAAASAGGGDLERRPLSSWLLLAALAGLPAAWSLGRPPHDVRVRTARGFRRWLTALLLLLSAWSAAAYVWRATPHAGGVDWFAYLCWSRDMLADPAGSYDAAYRYFPGVYAFWRAVLRWGGGRLEAAQAACAGLLVANALLLAAAVARLARSAPAAAYAAIWYLVLCSRFEGFTGVTEPLATAPLLGSLLLWGGRAGRTGRGVGQALLIGAGFGLAAYAKQQALLLWAAGVAPAAQFWRRRAGWALAALAVAAPCALAGGLAAEGRGLRPLQSGLAMAASYPRQGGWGANLWAQVRNDESAAAAGLAGLAAAGWAWWRLRRAGALRRPWLAACLFAWLAVAAACGQFAARPYRHYALLGSPFLVLAVVVAACRLVGPWLAMRLGELGRFALAAAAAFPLCYTGGDPHNLHVWRIAPAAHAPPQRVWCRRPAVAADLARLRSRVRPGQRLYVLPPRRNAVYFLLGARSAARNGYAFDLDARDAAAWDRADAVLVLTGELDETDAQFWIETGLARVAASLEAAGFRPALSLPTMTLYARTATGQTPHPGGASGTSSSTVPPPALPAPASDGRADRTR